MKKIEVFIKLKKKYDLDPAGNLITGAISKFTIPADTIGVVKYIVEPSDFVVEQEYTTSFTPLQGESKVVADAIINKQMNIVNDEESLTMAGLPSDIYISNLLYIAVFMFEHHRLVTVLNEVDKGYVWEVI